MELPTPATHTPLATDCASVLNDLLLRSSVGLNQAQAEAAKPFQEFEDLFAVDESECTHTDLVKHMIDTGSTASICLLPRHLPLTK